MTRINCVPVEELTNKHLLAEYRELPRIFSLLRKSLSNGKQINIPLHYKMGSGHMTFFFDKLQYLCNRHAEIVKELLLRKYSLNFTESLKVDNDDLPEHFWNDWIPTEEAKQINRERILLRLTEAKK